MRPLINLLELRIPFTWSKSSIHLPSKMNQRRTRSNRNDQRLGIDGHRRELGRRRGRVVVTFGGGAGHWIGAGFLPVSLLMTSASTVSLTPSTLLMTSTRHSSNYSSRGNFPKFPRPIISEEAELFWLRRAIRSTNMEGINRRESSFSKQISLYPD